MHKSSVLLLFLVLLLTACQRDEGIDTEIRTTILNPPTDPITGSIVGNVYEATLEIEPVGNAVVYLGDLSTETDAAGNFSFDNVRLYENGSHLIVEKDGYFAGSRKFNAFKDEVHNLEIQLIRREESGNLQTSSGGEASFDNVTVGLPSGNYLTEDGTYVGDMNIYGRWLDPTDETSFSAFPGNLTGINKDAELKTLASFGIIIMEVEGSEGQDIQLPEGALATLKLPIPEIMKQYAQESLELWYYDQMNGTWVEEGTAYREGDFYIAEVSHVAYWSINMSFDEVTLTAPINIDGFPALNRQVKINAPATGFITFTTTSSEGQLSVSIPEGDVLNLTIEGDCINTPFEITLESQFDDASHEEAIELTSRSESFSISGNALTCDGEELTQGWIRIQDGNDNEMLRTNADGSYEVVQTRCIDEPIMIYAIDYANNSFSQTELISGAYDTAIPDLISCTEIPEINFTQQMNYTNMNWETEWDASVQHHWEWSFIDGLGLTILNITIKDDQETYMTGAIRFNGEASQFTLATNYLFTFPTQGFDIRGNGEVIAVGQNGLVSYQFSEIPNDDPTITKNDSTYPDEGISDFTFNLVYFD